LGIKKKPPMESCWSTNFVRHFHVPWLFWLRHFLVPLSAIGELAEPCLFLLSLYLTLTFSSRLTLLRQRCRKNFFHNAWKFYRNTQHREPRISLLIYTSLTDLCSLVSWCLIYFLNILFGQSGQSGQSVQWTKCTVDKVDKVTVRDSKWMENNSFWIFWRCYFTSSSNVENYQNV
jgi:apolipoprotein N-acyltransferase